MNRRDFITATAATLAGGALSSKLVADASYQRADGATYAPVGKPSPVVKPGEFLFAAAHLDHAHINGMCNGLTEAGATLAWVYDPDSKKAQGLAAKFPGAKLARSVDEILADPAVKLVSSSAVFDARGALGCRVMEAGKDFFSDKPPFTTLEQLEQARAVVKRTGRKYMVYYSERLHVESAMFATDLIAQGAVGRVIQVINLAPHRISKATRPDWFFQKKHYGGILCDIGSHQMEQFLTYSGATDATVAYAAVGNFGNPDKPELEDFGNMILSGNNGAQNYVQVHWFTPDGLSTWGDGRLFVLGTKGMIELRKYIDVTRDPQGDHVYLVDGKGAQRFDVSGKVGYRYFGQLILDCLNRTENAMTQAHAFKVAEICIKAEASAIRLAGFSDAPKEA
jgi:predicted dehydrogenase